MYQFHHTLRFATLQLFFSHLVKGWTDGTFCKEVILPQLVTNAPPTFSNGTSFSNPYLMESMASPIPATYTNDPSIVNRWLSNNIPLTNEFTTIGFDVESVPVTPWMKNKVNFEGPATVQFATPSSCLVVHLTRRYGQKRTPSLNVIKAVLEDESIIKVGAGIDEDMLELYRFNKNVQANSRFDLGGIATNSSHNRIGLKALVKGLLGIELQKSKKLSMSNWSKYLTDAQIHYCARDAWAGAAVLSTLEKNYPEMFNPNSLYDLIKNERSIVELDERAFVRKSAKKKMKLILEQFKKYSDLPPTTSFHDLKFPPLVQKEVEELQLLMRDNAPDGLQIFDAEFLGFSLVSK